MLLISCPRNKAVETTLDCLRCHETNNFYITRPVCQEASKAIKTQPVEKGERMKFDLSLGKVGIGRDYTSPAALASEASMPELVLLGRNLGIKVSSKKAKAKAAWVVWDAAKGRLAGVEPAAEVTATPRAKAGKAYVFKSFSVEVGQPQAREMLQAAQATGKTILTKEELLAAFATGVKTQGKNIWANFMWYKSKVFIPLGVME